jgi:hypothetical protein
LTIMPTSWRALVLLFLVALSGCAGVAIQPCNDLPRQSTGLCSIGRSTDHQ